MGDAASGKELLTFKGYGWIFSAAFSPDGKRIVTGDWGGTAMGWEAASAEQVADWHKGEQAAAAAEAKRARAQPADMPGSMKQCLAPRRDYFRKCRYLRPATVL